MKTEKSSRKSKFPTSLKIIIPIVFVLAAAYLTGVVMFYGRYGLNTTVNGDSVLRQKPADVREALERKADDWEITVKENGEDCGTLKGTDIGLLYDASDLDNYPDKSSWMWPIQIFKNYDIEVEISASVDSEKLREALEGLDFAHADREDFDAGVSYNPDAGSFIVTDSSVDVIEMEKLLPAAEERILSSAVSEEHVFYEITDDDIYMTTPENLYTARDEANELIKAEITYAFDGGVVIDKNIISQWIAFDSFMNVSLDEELIQKWIDDLYDKYDNQTVVRYITSPVGEVTEYSGGDFGYEIITDNMLEEIVSAIKEKKTVELYDFGNSYCEVDISRQHMWYIIEGEVKFEADVVTGSYGTRETSRGQWSILEKQRNRTLRGDYDEETGTYEYETPVSYWMRVTWSGVGFHDATWQSAFGGERYKQGYGSHGCINMSYSNAQTLYDLVWVGMPVIIHN